jgi:hypothetical protein
MDSHLFQTFKNSLDEPQIYHEEGNHILLRREKATIPVILSAPHGGGDKNFPTGAHSMKPRLPGGKNVSMKADLYTLQMIASIDKHIFALSGQHCYVIAATVHRRFVDANRNSVVAEENAHNPECNESKAYYHAYHASIASCIEDCKQKHPEAPLALLLDIHGQVMYKDMVVLGTKNRHTCGVLNDAGSSKGVDEPLRGFIWHYQTLLGRASLPHPGDEDISLYSGGHIVCRYGIKEQRQRQRQEQEIEDEQRCHAEQQRSEEESVGVQVAAVQLEFGSSLRTDPTLRGEERGDACGTAVDLYMYRRACFSFICWLHGMLCYAVLSGVQLWLLAARLKQWCGLCGQCLVSA